MCTRFGNFNLHPNPGEALIPRNFGEGPGYFAVNMRVSKTWNFGTMPSSRAAANQRSGWTTPQAAAGAWPRRAAVAVAAVFRAFLVAAVDRAVAGPAAVAAVVAAAVAAVLPGSGWRQAPKQTLQHAVFGQLHEPLQ